MEEASDTRKAFIYAQIGRPGTALMHLNRATNNLRNRLRTARQTAMTVAFDRDEFLAPRQLRERGEFAANIDALEGQFAELRAAIRGGNFTERMANEWTDDAHHFLGAFDHTINRFLDENVEFVIRQGERDQVRWEVEDMPGAPEGEPKADA